MLTAEDIRLILAIIAAQHGPGYSDNQAVGRLQAKLSIMLDVAARREPPKEAP